MKKLEHYEAKIKPLMDQVEKLCIEHGISEIYASSCGRVTLYLGDWETLPSIRTGRRFVGVERDPGHYATALKRITNELAQGDLFLGHNDQRVAPPGSGQPDTQKGN